MSVEVTLTKNPVEPLSFKLQKSQVSFFVVYTFVQIYTLRNKNKKRIETTKIIFVTINIALKMHRHRNLQIYPSYLDDTKLQ